MAVLWAAPSVALAGQPAQALLSPRPRRSPSWPPTRPSARSGPAIRIRSSRPASWPPTAPGGCAWWAAPRAIRCSPRSRSWTGWAPCSPDRSPDSPGPPHLNAAQGGRDRRRPAAHPRLAGAVRAHLPADVTGREQGVDGDLDRRHRPGGRGAHPRHHRQADGRVDRPPGGLDDDPRAEGRLRAQGGRPVGAGGAVPDLPGRPGGLAAAAFAAHAGHADAAVVRVLADLLRPRPGVRVHAASVPADAVPGGSHDHDQPLPRAPPDRGRRAAHAGAGGAGVRADGLPAGPQQPGLERHRRRLRRGGGRVADPARAGALRPLPAAAGDALRRRLRATATRSATCSPTTAASRRSATATPTGRPSTWPTCRPWRPSAGAAAGTRCRPRTWPRRPSTSWRWSACSWPAGGCARPASAC